MVGIDKILSQVQGLVRFHIQGLVGVLCLGIGGILCSGIGGILCSGIDGFSKFSNLPNGHTLQFLFYFCCCDKVSCQNIGEEKAYLNKHSRSHPSLRKVKAGT